MMTLDDRIRNYIDKMPLSIQGQQGAKCSSAVACVLVGGWGLSEAEAMPFFREYGARCSPPLDDAKLRRKLAWAMGKTADKPRGELRRGKETGSTGSVKAPPQLPRRVFRRADWAKINEAAVEGFIAGVPAVDEGWFARRSPVDVSKATTADFLSAVFRDGDRVLIFSRYFSQGDFLFWVGKGCFRLADERGVKAVRGELPKGGPLGVWFLVQPVSGAWEINGTDAQGRAKYTRRSEGNVGRWDHFVLESDELDAERWMRVVAALRLPIVAIYTSGGRSIHALVRHPVPSKPDWDVAKFTLEKFVCPLGADPGALSAVRLSRLPGCLRFGCEEKVEGAARPVYRKYASPRLQRLIYLNPSPTFEAVMNLQEVRA